ncbi:MAG: hypothetical protein HRU46_21435 [Verrucomicrobiales bacterium]|nr:hypothetical protein [Verrucomicrobiales bacterium]
MKHLWQRYRKSRWWIRWGVAFLILIPLFYLIENYRGHLAWKECKERYKALGISLLLEDYRSEPIPVSSNLAEQPLTRTYFPDSGSTPHHFFHPDSWESHFASAYDKEREFAMAGYFFNAMEYYREPIAHLEHTALELDFSSYPAHPDTPGYYWDPSRLQKSMSLLEYKAKAHFHLGEYEEGLRSLDALLSLARKTGDHSLTQFLIEGKFRSNAAKLLTDSVPPEHLSNAQLQTLAALLKKHATISPTNVLNQERALTLYFFDQIQKNRTGTDTYGMAFAIPNLDTPTMFQRPGLEEAFGLFKTLFDKIMGSALIIAPAGWIDQNRVLACQVYDDDAITRKNAAERVQRYRPYTFLAHYSAPVLDRIISHTNSTNFRLLVLQITVAMERYRRANSTEPSTIEDLVPTYLPAVPVAPGTGRPLVLP